MALSSSTSSVAFRQYTYLDPYSGIKKVMLKRNFVQLHAIQNVVEISIEGEGGAVARNELKCKIVPIPLRLPRECFDSIHSLLHDVKQLILSVQTTLLWLSIELDRSLLCADQLVHLIRCTCDATFEKRGDCDRWITKSELVAIGKRVLENFVDSDQTEELVHEVVTLAGAEVLTEQALEVLHPFTEIHKRNVNRYLSFLEGKAAALQRASHVNAKTLNDLLVEASGHLQRVLHQFDAPEARDELLALFKYYAAIVDQMVDQEIQIIKDDHLVEIMDQLQLFKKDYCLDDIWFCHRIKKPFHHRVVTRDDDILFFATYVQQGLVHLMTACGKWDTLKNQAPAIANLTVSLGITVGAAVATGGLSLAKDAVGYVNNLGDFISGATNVATSGYAFSSALLKILAKDKDRHVWYLSLRETRACLTSCIQCEKADEIEQLLTQLRQVKPAAKQSDLGVIEYDVGSEAYTYFLYGVMDVLSDHIHKVNRSNQMMIVNFLKAVVIDELNGNTKSYWIAKRNKILHKAFVTLQEVYYKLDVNDTLRHTIDSTFWYTLRNSGTWQMLLDTDKNMQPFIQAMDGVIQDLSHLENDNKLIDYINIYILFWKNLKEMNLSKLQLKRINTMSNYFMKLTGPDDQRITQIFCDLRGYDIAQFLIKISHNCQSKQVITKVCQLLSSLYREMSEEIPSIKIEFNRQLQDLWWSREDHRNPIAKMLGLVPNQWMLKLSSQLPDTLEEAEHTLPSLQKTLEEAPWLHTANLIEAELFWHPVSQVYDKLRALYLNKTDDNNKQDSHKTARGLIRQIFFELLENSPNLPHPSVELSIQRFLLARSSISDVEREKIHAMIDPKVFRSPLVEKVVKNRYRTRLEATECWETIREEICFNGFPSLLSTGDQKKQLDIEFDAFMESEKTVMLLKGAPGSGKTTLLRYLANEVALSNLSYTPVFVSLAELRQPDGGLFKQVFEDALIREDEIADWRENRPFLFLFDGFEEMKNSFHLYHTNKMYQWKRSKFVFTCRSQFEGDTANDMFFVPRTVMGREETERFVEYQLAPFTEDQRKRYLTHFVVKNHKGKYLEDPAWAFLKKWGCLSSIDIFWKYDELIKEFESIDALSRNPFILRALIETLPDYFPDGKTYPETRTEIYEKFIEKRLQADTERVKKLFSESIEPRDLRRFYVVMSLYMLRTNNGGIFDVTSDNRIKNDDPYTSLEAMGYNLPTLDAYRGFHQFASMIVPAGADSYKFMHNTIFEYFAACGLIDSLKIAPSVVTHVHEIMHHPINYMAMLSSSEMLRFFREMIDHLELQNANVGDEDKTKWVQFLFSIIHMQQKLLTEEETRVQGLGIKNAVSNALTMLNLLGVSFSGSDLTHLTAPGASLVNATLIGTKIADASFGHMDKGLTEWNLIHTGNLERITNIKPIYTEDGDQMLILVSGMMTEEDGERSVGNGIFYLYTLDKNGKRLCSQFIAGEMGTNGCTIVNPNNYVVDSEHQKLYFVGHNSKGDPAEIQVRDFNGSKAHSFANYADKFKDDLSWGDGTLTLGSSVGGEVSELPEIQDIEMRTAIVYSDCRGWIAIGNADGFVEIWKVNVRGVQNTLMCVGKLQQTPITTLAFMPDHQSVLVGDNEAKFIHHWDFQSLIDPTFNRLFKYAVHQISLHQDGSLRIKSKYGRVFRWEIMQEHYVCPEEISEKFTCNHFEEVANKKRRIFGKDVKNGDARIKELSDQQVTPYKNALIEKFKQGPYKEFALNLSDKRVKIDLEAVSKSIVVMSCDHVVMILYGQGDWTQKATVHPSPVNEILISDDEQTLITKSTDGTVVVWKLDKNAKQFNIIHKLTNTPFFINLKLDK